ncbi:MAG: hypothetical protein NWF11_02650 [Candidatus Bathyarchaeota archaeon]|nr:hypothetical protein [Candidatus Bathyarchaeota archaeon]
MDPLISPQVNAVLQIIILVLLLVGVGIKRRQKHVLHGITLLAAVILNLLSFVLIMFPSLIRMEIISTQPLYIISLATLIHSAIGIVVIILGIWLVSVWRLQSNLKNCFKNKKLMRLTTAMWLSALLIGFLLYSLLYIY